MVYYRFPEHYSVMLERMKDSSLLLDLLVQCTSKKHLAKFTADTPRALYMPLSQDGIDPVQIFIEVIRESVWSRIKFEDELPPSFDALWHHWQRTCWVSNMWNQATSNHMRLLNLGWKIVYGKLDWESVENGETVRCQLSLLFRGYSCSSDAVVSRKATSVVLVVLSQ